MSSFRRTRARSARSTDRLTPLAQRSASGFPTSFRCPSACGSGRPGAFGVVAYNTKAFKPADLPDTILGYTDKRFRGRLGIAPTNASFQAFVTVMRLEYGDDKTREFLNALKANESRPTPRTSAIVEAIASGEIDLGLVNHYYLALLKKEQPDAPVANHFLTPGDPGAFVNVAGVGIFASSRSRTRPPSSSTTCSRTQASGTTQRRPRRPSTRSSNGLAGPGGSARAQRTSSATRSLWSISARRRRQTLELLNEVGLTS